MSGQSAILGLVVIVCKLFERVPKPSQSLHRQVLTVCMSRQSAMLRMVVSVHKLSEWCQNTVSLWTGSCAGFLQAQERQRFGCELAIDITRC